MDDCSTFDIFHVIQQQSPIRDRFFEHPVQMLLPRIVRQDKYNHVPINPRDQMAWVIFDPSTLSSGNNDNVN